MFIIRIDQNLQSAIIDEIMKTYQESFGGAPWNEGYVCPCCDSVFPLVPKLVTCPTCNSKGIESYVNEYWPKNKILSDFNREMSKAGSICIASIIENKVTGFAWGYNVTVNSALDEHLDAPNVHTKLDGDFFYLDECAITPAWQGKGLGKILVQNILKTQSQKKILLRTMNNSRMCNIILGMGGEIVQHISRERVIMKVSIST